MIKLKKPLAFFDIESTGTDAAKDRIITIAGTIINPENNSRANFSFELNPGVPIPEESTKVHGITNEQVKDNPLFIDLAEDIMFCFAGCDIAGFNSNKFDVPMLHSEFTRAGFVWDLSDVALIDVSNIHRRQNPQTLGALYENYTGKVIENAHDAAADIAATIELFEAELVKYPELLNMDANQLGLYCNNDKERVDIAGKFAKNEAGKIVFTFGKHKDVQLYHVARVDVQYLYFLLRGDNPPDFVSLINGAINWAHPKPEKPKNEKLDGDLFNANHI